MNRGGAGGPATVLAVPNMSEGRDEHKIRGLAATVQSAGARVLDTHSDPVHHRSVFTVAGSGDQVVGSMARLAGATRYIDLRTHRGAHPRLGGLDVCPIVAFGIPLKRAVALAHEVGRAIAAEAGMPVYLYGAAAGDTTRELPSLRRGGLTALIARAAAGMAPDFGPSSIAEETGVVCVGARGVLIAFNVWLSCDEAAARLIAAAVRSSGSGPPGLRAIGLAMGDSVSQVSMNLVDPARTGIDAAFEAVEARARALGESIIRTEIVGLVPERFGPDPRRQAARLLEKPGRTLESALGS